MDNVFQLMSNQNFCHHTISIMIKNIYVVLDKWRFYFSFRKSLIFSRNVLSIMYISGYMYVEFKDVGIVETLIYVYISV